MTHLWTFCETINIYSYLKRQISALSKITKKPSDAFYGINGFHPLTFDALWKLFLTEGLRNKR